jgi:hypothetical protein
MSCGDLALSRAKSCFRTRSAWFGWIFALDPVRKNRSTPLCRKFFITRIVYIIAIHVGNQQHDWCLRLTFRLLPPPAHSESDSFTPPDAAMRTMLPPAIGHVVILWI